MKLLVISDTHHKTDLMQYAAAQCKPDAILHLGDHISDAYELRRQFPAAALYAVKGNCDFQLGADTELLLTFEGVNIYMTHGHMFGVKSGLTSLIEGARRVRAGLALYGHTHKAALRQESGLWLMNPGQMERHDSSRAASYGIVNIDGDAFQCDIVCLPL